MAGTAARLRRSTRRHSALVMAALAGTLAAPFVLIAILVGRPRIDAARRVVTRGRAAVSAELDKWR